MPAPPLSNERAVTTADGVRLHLEDHGAAGTARGAVVMLHGFGVHSGPYRRVAAAFAAAGFAVTAFDTRGHGQSTGPRGYVRRFSLFQDDLQTVVEGVRAAHPGLPLALLGHSHGALIALDYALAERSRIEGLILAAPYLALQMKVPGWKTALSGVMGRLWPRLTLGNEVRSEDTTRDPDMRAALADDPLAHHVATPRWFNEVRDAQTHILTRASTLRVPTFMALAGDDRIVRSDVALKFAQDAGAVVQVRQYQQAFHELFLEPSWQDIVSDMTAWLATLWARGDSRLGSQPS